MVHLSFIKVHAWVAVVFKHTGINEKQQDLHSDCSSSVPVSDPIPSNAQVIPSLVTHNLCQTSVKNKATKRVIIMFFLFLFYRPAPLSH